MAKPQRFHVWLLFLVMIVAAASQSRAVEASRPIATQNHQLGYLKMFATLGVVCKCCDGERGVCRNTWNGSCSKLQCLPWKFH